MPIVPSLTSLSEGGRHKVFVWIICVTLHCSMSIWSCRSQLMRDRP